MMQSTIAIISLHFIIKIVIEFSPSVYLGWAGLKIALSMTFCYIMDSTSKVVRIVAPLQVKVKCYQIIKMYTRIYNVFGTYLNSNLNNCAELKCVCILL